MATYEIITLVDITKSQPKKLETDKLIIGQRANFDALSQTIGLRSNFNYSSNPKKDTGSLPRDIGGKSTFWIWRFDTERDDVFLNNDTDHTFFLRKDLHGVPVIPLLENTADIDPAVFVTEGKNINTWIYKIHDFE